MLDELAAYNGKIDSHPLGLVRALESAKQSALSMRRPNSTLSPVRHEFGFKLEVAPCSRAGQTADGPDWIGLDWTGLDWRRAGLDVSWTDRPIVILVVR